MTKNKKNPTAAIIELIKQVAYSKSVHQVFCDFVEMSAIAISNAVAFTTRAAREARYLDIINSYEKKHHTLFQEMLIALVLALDEKAHTSGPEDILGAIFHELELHSPRSSQFFTPQGLSDMIALMSFGGAEKALEERGFIHVAEPACGSGTMVTSLCKVMLQNGFNYNQQLLVTATDIDLKCVHMAYLQLSLYGVPAVVIHGNTLTLEEWSRWYTPVYVLHGWRFRNNMQLPAVGF